MYSLQTIGHINFEITSFCNAKCPQCQRFDIFGKIHKDLSLRNLDKNIIKTLPLEKMKNLKKISFRGNFGDPLMHPELDDILSFFSTQQIVISTNASLRSTKWWANLAKKNPNLSVIFCIDGLENTHSLYRINTSFEKIIHNAKSFIDNGGKAIWQFIVFKHNEHQISEAKKMARLLKFQNITFMYSERFDTSNTWKVYKQGKHSHNLEKSTNQTTYREYSGTPEGKKYWKELYKGAEKKNIECIWSKNKEIYIHSDGNVLPCCYMGSIFAGKQIEKKLYEKIIGQWSNINLYQNNLEQIINGYSYKRYFADALKNNPHPMCIELCNKKSGKLYNKHLDNV